MILPYEISRHGGELYQLFYALPFYLVSAGMLWVGLRRGYTPVSLVLVLAMGRMGFLLGAWLGGLGSLASSGRSTLFALASGALFVVATVRTLRFAYPVLDLYALFIPLGLALQRLGCLSVGCCFGLPTQVPWGLQYVSSDAAHALLPPIHAVPLYFMLAYVVVFAILWGARTRLNFRGALAALAFALLSWARFGVEFFRDPLSNPMLGGYWLGLKGVQWVAGGMGVLGLGLLAFLAVRHRQAPEPSSFPPLPPARLRQRQFAIVGVVAVLMAASTGLLRQAEWIAQLPLFLALAGAFAYELGKWRLPRVAWILLGMAGLSSVALADESFRKFYLITGLHQGYASYPRQETEGCMGPVYSDYYSKQYTSGELGLRISRQDLEGIRTSQEIEASVLAGSYYRSPGLEHEGLGGVRVRLDLVWGWFGLGLGAIGVAQPSGAVIGYEHPFGHVQVGNFRNLYLIAGSREDYSNTPFMGLGGASPSRAWRWAVGGTEDGFFTDLSFHKDRFGIELKQNTDVMHREGGSRDASLRLLWGL